ncbi:MAG: phospholipid/cholesterol/gamma-HCH transport system substrate-binding protein [Thermoleophilaceae bacterium]|jgi:virulence factor Mce-like protein|nr:phospholipid/cholesterol/gamma-HCH transport system substrate-binding protein [Thermoleophilaceae bacterium]
MSAEPQDRRKALVGLTILVVGAALFALFFLGVIPQLLNGAMRTVRADFVSTGSLHVGEPVRIDGANVGTVRKVTVHPGGQGATVEMALENSSGDLYADATAAIQWRTLLGASYAVALGRGTPAAGPLGTKVIPQQRTSYQVELDEVTGALRQGARTGMQSIFHELPKAFADKDVPGSTLRDLAANAPQIATGLDALRGTDPDEDVANLVAYTGRAMRALGASPDELNALVRDAAITFGTTGAHGADISDTLVTAASALPRVRSTLTRLDRTLDLTNPVLNRLRDNSGRLSPALAQLDPVVRDADKLLSDKAEPLMDSLRPTARSLARTARGGSPLLKELAPSLGRIQDTILPDLARKSPESDHTTYEMIGPAVAGVDAMAAHYDSSSHYIRLFGSGGGRVLDSLPCRAYFTDPGSDSLLQCQQASDAFQTYFGGSYPGTRTAGGK